MSDHDIRYPVDYIFPSGSPDYIPCICFAAFWVLRAYPNCDFAAGQYFISAKQFFKCLLIFPLWQNTRSPYLNLIYLISILYLSNSHLALLTSHYLSYSLSAYLLFRFVQTEEPHKDTIDDCKNQQLHKQDTPSLHRQELIKQYTTDDRRQHGKQHTSNLFPEFDNIQSDFSLIINIHK